MGAEPICISFIMAKWLCKLAEDQSPWKKGHGRSLRPLATSSYARQPLLFGHPTWKYCLCTGKPSSNPLIPTAEKQTNSCWPRRGGKRAVIQIPSRQRVKSALGCLCEAGNFWESVCRWLKAHLDRIFSDKSSDPLLISVLLPTPSVYSSQTLI